jgi:pre-rRNA-processing protein IPI1
MTSSSKKKREKKKDFQVREKMRTVDVYDSNYSQKPKLKVGNTRPKAANSTDTSFRAKCEVYITWTGGYVTDSSQQLH